MASLALKCAVCLFLSVCFSGCADIVERTKPHEQRPPILEEDVTRENPEVGSGQQSTSQESLPPALPHNSPQAGDPADRPPRHLIWRDRKESGQQDSGSRDGN